MSLPRIATPQCEKIGSSSRIFWRRAWQQMIAADIAPVPAKNMMSRERIWEYMRSRETPDFIGVGSVMIEVYLKSVGTCAKTVFLLKKSKKSLFDVKRRVCEPIFSIKPSKIRAISVLCTKWMKCLL